MTRLATPMITQKKFKIFDLLLIFVNLCQHAKNQFIPSVHPSDTVGFRVLSRDWPHPYLTIPTPKMFNHLLISMKLYLHAIYQLITSVHSWDTVNFRVQKSDWLNPYFDQHAKNGAVLPIFSGDIVDLKIILQSEWLRKFWAISQE